MGIKEDIKQSSFKNKKQEAFINLLFTNNYLTNIISNILKKFDITMQQYNVLRILKGSHPRLLSAQDVLDVMVDKSPDLTRLISRLEDKKFVIRSTNPQNKRKIMLEITEEGSKLVETNNTNVEIDTFLKNLTEEEATILSSLLDKIRA